MLGGFRRRASQAVPPKCGQRINVPFRPQGFFDSISGGEPRSNMTVHEASRADVEALVLFPYNARHTKVCHQGFPLGGKQHIARRDVPMGRPLGMKVGQHLGNRSQYRHSFPDVQLAPDAHEVRKGTSGRIVHDQAKTVPAPATQLHDVVNPDKVLVLKPGQDPNLTEGAFVAWWSQAPGFLARLGCGALDSETGAVLVPAGKPDYRGSTRSQLA
jgi:hypothetical protein